MNDSIKLKISEADLAPDDLNDQLPFSCRLIRQISGPDRPDYWIAQLEKPIIWGKKTVNYIVIAPRFIGVVIKKGMGRIVLGVAYVIDESLLTDARLDFGKCEYTAICIAEEVKE
jgi:hypothetical protein